MSGICCERVGAANFLVLIVFTRFSLAGVKGIVVNPTPADALYSTVPNVANERECSHACQTTLACVAYCWVGDDSDTSVLTALKSLLSIGAGGGTCYNFDETRAGRLHSVRFWQNGQSGLKEKHADIVAPRLKVCESLWFICRNLDCSPSLELTKCWPTWCLGIVTFAPGRPK